MTAEDVEIEDIGSNPALRETLEEIAARRLSRRGALAGLAAAAMLPAVAEAQPGPESGGPSSLTFTELPHQLSQRDAVAPGHEIQVVIRWGDPVLADAPALRPAGRHRRRPGQAVRLQQRLPGLLPAAAWLREQRPRPAGGEPRIHQHQPDVPRPRRRPRRRAEGQRRAGGGGDGGAWRLGGGDAPRSDGRWGCAPDSPLQPPHHRRDPDAHQRPRRRPSAGCAPAPTRSARRCSARSTTAPAAIRPGAPSLTAEENFNNYFGGTAATDGCAEGCLQALRHPAPGQLRLVPACPPLQPRQGAERAEPLRLDGRVRPLRPGLGAGEAHRARPLQA